MRIHRLLAIVTYLLNRDVVTCKELAGKYEVSERTIQRDVDNISMAGIPIYSLRGSNGGYKIMDHYKVSKQTSNEEDLLSIVMALESLQTALLDEGLDGTLERIKSMTTDRDASVSVDFGVVSERAPVMETVKLIRKAIKEKKLISFSYINAEGKSSEKKVDPVSVNFKWYAWYLVGNYKERYMIYKLIRMNNPCLTEEGSTARHDPIKVTFDKLMENDLRPVTKVVLEVDHDALPVFLEYMPNSSLQTKGEKSDTYVINIIEGEFFPFSVLLGLGSSVLVKEPKAFRDRLLGHIEAIEEKYGNRKSIDTRIKSSAIISEKLSRNW